MPENSDFTSDAIALIRSSKKAVKFDTKHAEWCTYLNMRDMNNEVYISLVTSGLAVKPETNSWRNETEKIKSKENAVGCNSAELELIHPDWLVFINKVGSNTPQTKDGNGEGEMYTCTKEGNKGYLLYHVGFHCCKQ